MSARRRLRSSSSSTKASSASSTSFFPLMTISCSLHIGANSSTCCRIQHVQLPKVEKNCPTLYAILTGEQKSKDGIFHGTFPGEGSFIGKEVPCPDATYLPQLLTADVIKSVQHLADTVYACYRELWDNPPFPEWKKQLGEIWNG